MTCHVYQGRRWALDYRNDEWVWVEASALEEVWNGNELVYSVLLTRLYSVLQSDWPPNYWALEQKMVYVVCCQTLSASILVKLDGSRFETSE